MPAKSLLHSIVIALGLFYSKKGVMYSLIIFDNRMRGIYSVDFCRDRGRGWVDAGALCLSSFGCAPFAPRNRPNRVATRTGTRPPPFPASTPCPYRTGEELANIIRTLFHACAASSWPVSVASVSSVSVGCSSCSSSCASGAGSGLIFCGIP